MARIPERVDESAPLTVPEVADRLRVGRAAVYSLVESGELPALRVGRSFRVLPEALDAFMASGAPKPTADVA